MPTPAELVLTGGAVYTADAAGRRMIAAAGPGGRPATAVAVAGGRIAAVGARDEPHRRADRAGHRGGRPARPGAAARLPGRARPPGLHRRDHGRLQPDGARDAGPRRWTVIGAYARGAPGEGVDHRQRLADGVVRRRHAGPRARSTRSSADRPAYLRQPGRPRRLGQLGARWSWAGLDRHTRTRRTAGSSARPTARPQGTLHEGAASLVGALVPEPSLDEQVAGLLLAQQHLHSARHHRLAGRHHRRLPRLR